MSVLFCSLILLILHWNVCLFVCFVVSYRSGSEYYLSFFWLWCIGLSHFIILLSNASSRKHFRSLYVYKQMEVGMWKQSDNRNNFIERHVLFIGVKYDRNGTQSVLLLILTNDRLGLWAEVGVWGRGWDAGWKADCAALETGCVQTGPLSFKPGPEPVFKEAGIVTKVISGKMRFLSQRWRTWRNRWGRKGGLFPGHVGSDHTTRYTNSKMRAKEASCWDAESGRVL